MGLLDWLTEGIGSNAMDGGSPMSPGPGGQMPMVDPMGNSQGMAQPLPTPAPAPTQPMPPMQGAGADVPQTYNDAAGLPQSPAPPGLLYNDAAGLPQSPAPPGGPPFPMGTDPMTAGMTTPLPAPRPPMAGSPVAGPAAIPPSAAPTGGTGMPPGPPMSLAPPGIAGQSPDSGINGLGRALGITQKTLPHARQFAAALGKGLSAAGSSAGMSKGQAFAHGAGAALTGSEDSARNTDQNEDKYLTRAIAFMQAGNAKAAADSIAKLREIQGEAIKGGQYGVGRGGTGVANSKEQLYLRALGATNSDGNLSILANEVKQLQKKASELGDPASKKAAADAMMTYKAEHQKTLDARLQTLGIDPKSISHLADKPGFSSDNPSKPTSRQDFDSLPDGAYFFNPATNSVRIKRSKQPAGGAGQIAPLPGTSMNANASMPADYSSEAEDVE